MIYVLDACAVIAMLDTEPGSQKVRDLFIESLTSDIRLCMSPVNLTEVYYDRINTDGPDKAKEIYSLIKASITITENITDDIVQEAGGLNPGTRFLWEIVLALPRLWHYPVLSSPPTIMNLRK
jgi:PIN domain nuclease of toxin-antitoxin system